VVNRVMYLTAANRVVALETESGKDIWEYSVTGGAPSRRGVAYSPGDGRNPPRILVTAGSRLIALNANTGKLDPGFGKEGDLDMVVPVWPKYSSSPAIISKQAAEALVTTDIAATGFGSRSRDE
jgi:glucose dehydrogenase